LADLADDLDVALSGYETALEEMSSKRPQGVDVAKIHRVKDLAAALVDAAAELDNALDRFRKKLAQGAA
jgi:hypothetical protein